MIKLVIRAAISLGAIVIGYHVYRILTRDSAREEINAIIKNNDKFKDAFKAKYEQKSETYNFCIMDKWDEPIGDIDLDFDEISSDIKVGDEIILEET